MIRRRSAAVWAAVALCLAAAVTLAVLTTRHRPTQQPTPAGPAAQLAGLEVRGEDTGAHYQRDQWGGWRQHGAGCDTRELLLIEQGTGETLGPRCQPTCPAAVDPCWLSPYDDTPVRDPAGLDVDHLVALKEAAQSGGRDWPPDRRAAYANDPLNLIAVTASVNRSKGDRDPGQWRPPSRGVWCVYATRWVATKAAWGLTVDEAERVALVAMLRTCPVGAG